MKKSITLPLLVLLIFSFWGCSTNDPVAILKNSDARSKVISGLLKNAEYSHELTDSMMKQMGGAEMTHNMMGGNKMMQMMKEDTSMSNLMMGQMMEMANKDSVMCNKMMSMMMNHPNISKQLINAQKKTELLKQDADHLKHHF